MHDNTQLVSHIAYMYMCGYGIGPIEILRCTHVLIHSLPPLKKHSWSGICILLDGTRTMCWHNADLMYSETSSSK